MIELTDAQRIAIMAVYKAAIKNHDEVTEALCETALGMKVLANDGRTLVGTEYEGVDRAGAWKALGLDVPPLAE